MICDGEKTFILHGIQENFRNDGREREEYRPLQLQVGVIPSAYGSSRIRLSNTEVLVSVKLEIDVPLPEKSNHGKLDFFIDCSANAKPEFEGRGGTSLATAIANCLRSTYISSNCLDMKKFCIVKGKKCWKICVDILILECSGNLYDTISIGVKTALWDTSIPIIKSVTIDGNEVILDISESIDDCERIDATNLPLLVTVCKVGDYFIIDPTAQEEECASVMAIISVAKEFFTVSMLLGSGSLCLNSYLSILKMTQRIGGEADEIICNLLKDFYKDEEVL